MKKNRNQRSPPKSPPRSPTKNAKRQCPPMQFTGLPVIIIMCMIIIMSDRFWIDDPAVLYKGGRYILIIPSTEMTRVEQLNAITRLCIYIIIIMLLFGILGSWLILPLAVIILVVILYNIYQ